MQTNYAYLPYLGRAPTEILTGIGICPGKGTCLIARHIFNHV